MVPPRGFYVPPKLPLQSHIYPKLGSPEEAFPRMATRNRRYYPLGGARGPDFNVKWAWSSCMILPVVLFLTMSALGVEGPRGHWRVTAVSDACEALATRCLTRAVCVTLSTS
jgi:hypothetical protein